jgi:uncharacterized protein (DUF433 family)
MNERVSINPMVCHGKPVIKGTRVLVANIIGALAGGDAVEDILQDYPNITREDVLSALDFAAQIARFEEAPYEMNPA